MTMWSQNLDMDGYGQCDLKISKSLSNPGLRSRKKMVYNEIEVSN